MFSEWVRVRAKKVNILMKKHHNEQRIIEKKNDESDYIYLNFIGYSLVAPKSPKFNIPNLISLWWKTKQILIEFSIPVHLKKYTKKPVNIQKNTTNHHHQCWPRRKCKFHHHFPLFIYENIFVEFDILNKISHQNLSRTFKNICSGWVAHRC